MDIFEVALSLENCKDTLGGERKKEGDIIAARWPMGAIGFKEAYKYLWLRIEGISRFQYNRIKTPVFQDESDVKSVIYDKRQYSIPLHRLKIVYPSFNKDRALDPEDIYQPFLTLDEDTFFFLTTVKPFNAVGLVFDKKTMTYL